MTEEEREIHLQRMRNFYIKCGEILGIETEFRIPFLKKTRWNVRILGNGRYPGFGVIKRFNDKCIHVVSYHGVHTFVNEDSVYYFLENLKND